MKSDGIKGKSMIKFGLKENSRLVLLFFTFLIVWHECEFDE